MNKRYAVESGNLNLNMDDLLGYSSCHREEPFGFVQDKLRDVAIFFDCSWRLLHRPAWAVHLAMTH